MLRGIARRRYAVQSQRGGINSADTILYTETYLWGRPGEVTEPSPYNTDEIRSPESGLSATYDASLTQTYLAMIAHLSLTATAMAGAVVASALGNTPQMGFNTWNSFKGNYNQGIIHDVADLMVSLGLSDAGYNYLILDEGWSDMERTDEGYLQSNRTTFPDGIKPLANRVHGMGLKVGLYGDSGILTCGFRPGSWGYEERDAMTLAEWGVDYWKYDNCGGFQAMTHAPQDRFLTMQNALLRTGRDIFFSVCEWGFQFPWHWGGSMLPFAFISYVRA